MRIAWIALLLMSTSCWAQTPENGSAAALKQAESMPDPAAAIAALEASVPAARPLDVRSIPAIMAAIYDVISGPPGPRDWSRFKSLMMPKARLTESTVDENGKNLVSETGVDEFIAEAQPLFTAQPFFETALVNRVQRFGNIAQVFSSYASRAAPHAEPFERGINSVQLLYDGKRWWVLSILWDKDRPGNPLPKSMSKG